MPSSCSSARSNPLSLYITSPPSSGLDHLSASAGPVRDLQVVLLGAEALDERDVGLARASSLGSLGGIPYLAPGGVHVPSCAVRVGGKGIEVSDGSAPRMTRRATTTRSDSRADGAQGLERERLVALDLIFKHEGFGLQLAGEVEERQHGRARLAHAPEKVSAWRE